MLHRLEVFYRAVGPWVLAALFALLPLLGWGFVKAIGTNTNNVRQWLPKGYEDTQTYQWFRRHFQSDEFALVTWDGCTLDDQRLSTFADAVVGDRSGDASDSKDSSAPDGAAQDGSEDSGGADDSGQAKQQEQPPLFGDVRTGPAMLEALMEPPLDLARKRAIDRLRGFVIGKDGKATCALVTLSDYGDRNRVEALQRLREIAIDEVGIDQDALYLTGGPVFNAHIDLASERAILNLPVWAVGMAVCVALVSLRSIRLTVAVFAAAAYCGLFSQAMVYFVGGNLNLVLVVMPVLVALLSLSAAVHLVNYYRDARAQHDARTAPAEALRRGFAPCTMAAATTAIGLASLLVSHVVPVREFGFYSAVGIFAGLALVFISLPSMLTLMPATSGWGAGDGRNGAGPLSAVTRTVRRGLAAVAEGILRRRVWVSLGCGAVLAAGAWGVRYVQTEVSTRRFFADDSRLLKDFRWVQDRFGPMVPLEAVVVVNRHESEVDFLERMRLVRDIEREMLELEGVSAAVSAATFAPPLEYEPDRRPGAQLGGVLGAFGRAAGVTPERVWRHTLSKRLEENRDEFASHGYLEDAGEEQLWRISARTARRYALESEGFLDDVAAHVRTFLDAQQERRVAGVRVEYTGMAPLLFAAQRELLEGLFRSFLTAFALIAVLMVVVLRSLRGGLLAMLPNIFPAAVVFGTMGHLGIRVDIGAMLTASAAMGIAVDDTVHFLSWFREGWNKTGSAREAVLRAYRRCSAAMCQTTAIAGLGLIVYAGSSFQPVSQFGTLMFVLLLVTLVGDLIFLPALLGWFGGRVFKRKPQPDAQANSRDEKAK